MNITTIKQITLLAIYGALTGLVIVSCLSGWSWVSHYSAMNGDFQFTFSDIVGVIISAFGLFFAGALYGIRDKQDWIVPAMILGAATGPFFFSSFERRYRKNFLVGLVLLTIIGVFFGWHRNQSLQEIDKRYVEFCAALEKHDYARVYTYMSPNYRQRVSFSEFPKAIEARSIYTNITSFVQSCPILTSTYWKKRVVDKNGNYGYISADSPYPGPFTWTSKIVAKLENIDGQWYVAEAYLIE